MRNGIASLFMLFGFASLLFFKYCIFFRIGMWNIGKTFSRIKRFADDEDIISEKFLHDNRTLGGSILYFFLVPNVYLLLWNTWTMRKIMKIRYLATSVTKMAGRNWFGTWINIVSVIIAGILTGIGNRINSIEFSWWWRSLLLLVKFFHRRI